MKECAIKVENIDEWIDTQNCLFKQNISWCNPGELEFRFLNNIRNIYPSYIIIRTGAHLSNFLKPNQYYMTWTDDINNITSTTIINASTIIRKDKLKKLHNLEK